MSFDLDAAQIRQLLDGLDQRLSVAGIAATVYVVGGAAISLHLPDTGRRTQDIDGITTDDRVADIVAQMADELGLPEGWLNGSARPFLPPIPADALSPPSSPGLRVQLASLDQLLAMKLVAGRARDRSDIIALATALQVNPEEAVQLTLMAYGVEALEVMTTLEDVTHDAEELIPEPPRA